MRILGLVKRLVSRGVKVVAVDICFAKSRLPESDMIETVEAGVDEKLADKISRMLMMHFIILHGEG